MDESQVKVAVLEERVVKVAEVFTRLESAIEKISNVSVDIKQMLAVHDERLGYLDDRIQRTKDQTLLLTENMARDAKEQSERIADMREELHEVESKLLEGQNSLEHRILRGQKDLGESLITHIKNDEKRIKALENWRYVLVGIFLVLGALVGIFAQNSVTITPFGP